MATCLGEEPELPLVCFWLLGAMGKGMGRGLCMVWPSSPLLNSSLTAAYLWFPHCPCCLHRSMDCCAKDKAKLLAIANSA